MRKSGVIVLLFAGLLLEPSGPSAAKENATSPEALISRARLVEEIWTAGMPSMLMRAEVQIADAKGALATGEYTFNWASPTRWREDIRFVNYERLRVRDANGYWEKSLVDYKPEVIFQLDTLLHLNDALRVEPKQTLGKTKPREENGVRQECTEVKWATRTDHILCFDESNGALLSVDYPTADNQHPPQVTRIEYAAFTPVGRKLVPYEIRALRDQKVVASVKILGIAETSEEKPELFNPPENAVYWAQCVELQDPELITAPVPAYPPNARANHEEGRVILYGVVEPDGSLSHTRVIQRATPALEAAALLSLSQWRYKPAMCGQTAVRTETSISLDFWLGR
ncbi:MAG TPA: TonB family protein [Candidatus Acidoferrales bacterium]|nr:TonB family protein [Candidatus Acidoferrales bacterium]